MSALTCALLLARRGVQIDLVPVRRRTLPAVVVEATTASLLDTVFVPSILYGAHCLRARIVDWSAAGGQSVVEQEAWVISEDLLLSRLRRAAANEFPDRIRVIEDRNYGDADLIIFAGAPAPSAAYRFGRRRATSQVKTTTMEDPSVCRMRSDADGWVFEAPIDARTSLLQRVDLSNSNGVLCAPRITWPPCGPGWFACGPSAMSMDPICGDGIGSAIRSALWLCGLIGARLDGAKAEVVTNDYCARLALAFEEHLAICLEYYVTARLAQAWESEIAATDGGRNAIRRLARGLRPMHYRLDGFEAVERITRIDQSDPAAGVEAIQ
jgi:hypothetical protein